MWDREQLKVHTDLFAPFVRACKEGVQSAPNAKRRTLLFFPGGMGSKLKRSTQTFVEGKPNASFDYEQVWGMPQAITGGAFKLGMCKQGDEYRDRENYLVIADGAFEFFNSAPHDGLIRWCKKNNIDLFVFNWDWRRPLEETAQFFIGQFWPAFVERMRRDGMPQAAENYSLLGHCFGGMIVNLILRSDSDVARGLKYAITLATPFYGYPGQLHRWFEGEPILNGPDADHRDEMIRIICSLPALYVLHSPDLEVTFPRDEAALRTDQGQTPAYPLLQYPTLDKETKKPLDPWKQQTDADGRVRYPVKKMGFMEAELAHAKGLYRQLASPLSDNRFYNIRGVAKNLFGDDTYGTVKAGWICGDFDPDREKPIHDDVKFPGDGVHPAWSARLASNAPGRCRTLRATGITHMCITSHADFLTELGRILFQSEKFKRIAALPPPDMATQRQVDEYIGWSRGYIDGYKVARRGAAPEDEDIRAAMRARYGDTLDALWRRILEDVFKVPPGARN